MSVVAAVVGDKLEPARVAAAADDGAAAAAAVVVARCCRWTSSLAVWQVCAALPWARERGRR